MVTKSHSTPFERLLNELDDAELERVLSIRESREELADLCGRMPTAATVRNWILESGRGFRFAGRWLWSRRDLLQYLDRAARGAS